MSSRAIEGENPLYLPQSKVYDRCCAIGPAVRSAASIDDPADLEIRMRIERDGDVLYDESTNTSRMVRSIDELVDWYLRHNAVPDVSVLLTGTSLVPDDEFTLEPADRIEIGIEESERSRIRSPRCDPADRRPHHRIARTASIASSGSPVGENSQPT